MTHPASASARRVATHDVIGVVSLRHVDTPHTHARHDLGWIANLDQRAPNEPRGRRQAVKQSPHDVTAIATGT